VAKKKLKNGVFITFEGPEGCGKSTHARRIGSFLKKKGYDVLFTREPGGTSVGEKIRDILLHPAYTVSPLTELFLFEAARAQIIEKIILPAIKRKKIIICDRFNDSTVVYQGYAGPIPLKKVIAIDDFIVREARPDLTILLDLEAKIGLRRALKIKPKDRMESKSLIFHKKVRKGFRDLARRNKKRIKLIDSRNSVEETQEAVRKEILKYLKKIEIY